MTISARNIGTQNIDTTRLFLRRFTITDAESVFSNWISDPEVQHNYGEPTYDTIFDTRQLLEKWIRSYDNNEFYRWAIILKETNVCIGQIAFYEVSAKAQRVDVEYCVGRAYWGNGYAPESLKAVIDYVFDKMQFNRVQAFHRSKNHPSGIVLKKAGMKYEGTLKQFILHQGEFDDCLMYAIIRKEWKNDV